MNDRELADEIGRCPLCDKVPSGPHDNPFSNGEHCWYITHSCFGVHFETRVQGKVPADAIKAWNKISALRRSQPEGMVMVPREPTVEMMEAAKPAFATIDAWCSEMQLARGRKPDWPENDPPLKQAWRLMLAAASKGKP